METPSYEAIWQALDEIKDPEIPVVSMVEMGMIRQVAIEGERVLVTMSPTFAGCPAVNLMQAEIKQRLKEDGVQEVQVQISFHPPWSSEWITESARLKLKAFGLSPPPHHTGDLELALQAAAICPRCGSQNTRLANSFGPTLCRAIYVCQNCREPFEQFKPM